MKKKQSYGYMKKFNDYLETNKTVLGVHLAYSEACESGATSDEIERLKGLLESEINRYYYNCASFLGEIITRDKKGNDKIAKLVKTTLDVVSYYEILFNPNPWS